MRHKHRHIMWLYPVVSTPQVFNCLIQSTVVQRIQVLFKRLDLDVGLAYTCIRFTQSTRKLDGGSMKTIIVKHVHLEYRSRSRYVTRDEFSRSIKVPELISCYVDCLKGIMGRNGIDLYLGMMTPPPHTHTLGLHKHTFSVKSKLMSQEMQSNP